MCVPPLCAVAGGLKAGEEDIFRSSGRLSVEPMVLVVVL